MEDGAEISIWYDPMISKLVCAGEDRAAALATLAAALDEYVIEGVAHNAPFLRAVCENETFRSGEYNTGFIQDEFPLGFSDELVLAQMAQSGDLATLAAVCAELDAKARAARREEALCGDVVVLLCSAATDSARTFTVQAPDAHGRVRVCDGATQRTVALGGALAEWRPFVSRLARAASGEILAQYVGADPRDGFQHALRCKGVRVDAAVRSPLEHALAQHAKPPPPKPPARNLRCPMPGALLSFAVKAGDAVQPGQALCVVEAMKMQNVLRAENAAVVKHLLVHAGDTLAADDLILDFE